MYSIEWSKVLPRAPREGGAIAEKSPECPVERGGDQPARRRLPSVHRTVWALGFTSLLTDISSEMISSILPMYLVLHLGMSPLMFGLVDGIYQGAAVLVRVFAGVLSDRWQRHKEIAAFGYSLSALCRILILAVGSAWGAIAAVVALDRVGKGIRTAPRDVLIARRSQAAELSTAFGVHRTLDAAGAMLGPVIAFAMLAVMPGQFDVLFVASFGIAIIGLGVLFLFVPAYRARNRDVGISHVSIRTALRLLIEPRFRGQVMASILLGLATVSDSFVFLILQKRLDLTITAFPLLYVGTSLFTAVFAAPLGRLADRFGRTKILIGGYVALLLVYLTLLLPSSYGMSLGVVAIVLFGIYYAATDGVLTAMAASVLPTEHSGSGLAVLATAANLARLSASIAFGLLWHRFGIGPATICFTLALVVAIAMASRILSSSKRYVV